MNLSVADQMNSPDFDTLPLATQVGTNDYAAAIAAVQAALARDDFQQAAVEIATQLAQHLHCTYVAIGMMRGRGVELSAISGMADVHGKYDLPRRLVAAMNEAVDQQASLRYPSCDWDPPCITLMHRELAASGIGNTFLSIPLPCRQKAVGAITLTRIDHHPWSDQEKTTAEQIAALFGPVLVLKQQAHEPLMTRLCAAPGKLLEKLRTEGLTPARWGAAILLLICLGGLLIPVRDTVSAQAHLEGVVQRSIAAPVDSYIQDVNVRPGFQVKAGQVLLALADNDMRLEQSRLEAELGRYRSNQADAFAQQDRSGMVASQAHIDEISAQLTLLRDQINRTRITAPFDGVIIRGDQQQLAGAPVKRGDVLMVISPDTDFRLILQVDERDIARIRDGQAGRVAFSALPGRTLALSVTRITPVSSIVDGDNTFEVEAALKSGQANLRPGLEGMAHIVVGRDPLAIIWGKHLCHWISFKLWAWLG